MEKEPWGMTNKVRVGIIGLGSWGSCHLEAFHSMPQVEVVALCDRNEERVRQLAETYGVAHAYTRSEELLDRSDIDVVSIATFEHEHFGPAAHAIRTGKHVLVEKPVSTKLEEAAALAKLAEENGTFLFAGHLLRFEPRYADIYEAIRSDRLGAPQSMYLKRGRTKGMFQTYKRTHTVYELTVHDLDIAIWYAGSRVKSVKAYGRAVHDDTVPDILWSCLEFENGTVAVLHSNWMTPDAAGFVMNDAVEIIGTKGTAQFANNGSNVQLWDERGRTSPDYFIHHSLNGSAFGALREQLTYICNCVAGGSKPTYTSFADAVHGIAVAEAIIRSCASGKEERPQA
ncbi:Gfo/Idh/MocA family protein [Paenibacillus ginsengarvi]|uniref:Gfo/Idh/MocA family oxidoreductase n=1 Tax=Paenibacillus ginsengarvi TaxID=400777 RepID=A0A3B0BM25_9BACL|nr:Gfo/Idh/MocA family oxidoreductase [Paenibacillus ginsengarvi]RKN74160.1 gfo/Idh/MocA family oxidoreductase [Paenibacillus ginsengarvi]